MAMDGAAPRELSDPTTDPDADPMSDAGLMRRVIGGSQEALAHLYDRHNDSVFGAAWRTSRDQSVAAEVVQETFLALWNKAELFDPSRGSLTSWLLTIARNRAVDHLRAAGRHDRAVSFSSFGRDGEDEFAIAEWLTASGELVGASKPDAAPDVILSSKETRGSIDDAIAALDPAERSVIVLAYAGGLSQSEIAAELGWPLGTVKTRTRRALGRLREMLDAPVDLDESIPDVADRAGSTGDAAPPRPRVIRADTAGGDSRVWNLAARPQSAAPAASCCS